MALGGSAADAGGAAPSRPEVFISYSRQDQALLGELRRFLAQYEDDFAVFIDTEDIEPGKRFDEVIKPALERAVFAVLLVSVDFVLSNYIRDRELPELTRRRVDLPWVLLGPCDWERMKAINGVNALHDVKQTGPLNLMSQEQRQVVWQEIAKKLADKVAHAGQQGATVGSGSASALGRLVDVPPAPPRYLIRHAELERLAEAVSSAEAVSVSGLSVVGWGGLGKSVLAAAVASSDQVRARFPGGVYWLSVGQRSDPEQTLRELAKLIEVDIDATNPMEAKDQLKSALAGRRLLVVADDVWSPAMAQALAVTTGESRLLVTTRRPEVAAAVGGADLRVDALSVSAALEFLTEAAGEPPPGDLVDELIDLSGGRPLALALAGATFRHGTSWDEVLSDLRLEPEAFVEPENRAVYDAIRSAWRRLPDPEWRERYLQLAVFPENTSIPILTVARLWGVDRHDAEELLGQLGARQLVERATDDTVALHDEKRRFVQLNVTDLELLHTSLLEAYRNRFPDPDGGWWQLADDEPYLWDHLVWHLIQSHDELAMDEAIEEPRWLIRRLWLGGRHRLDADLVAAIAHLPADHPAGMWRLRLRQCAHYFVALPNESSVANTLSFVLGDLDWDFTGPPPWLAPLDRPTISSALSATFEGHTGPVYGCVFSADGTRVVSASEDSTLRVWDVAGASPIATLEGHTGSVSGCAFSLDGTRIVSASYDKTLRIWDVAGATTVATLEGHTGLVSGCAFSPDGTRIVSASYDKTLRIWDVAGATTVATLEGHTDSVNGCAFSADGTRIVSASYDKTLRVWDVADAATIATLEGHTDPVWECAISPDGTRIVSASYDKTLRIWDVAGATTIATLEGHTDPVYGCAFSPDGTRIVSASWDNTLRIWDVAGATTIATLEGHTDPVYGCAFSPDGTRVVSASDDKTLRIWDVAGATTIATLEGHTDPVYGCAFSPDGTRMVSASDDKTLRVWDVAGATTVATLEGHTDSVSGCAFSPDGTRIVSASWDNALRIWDVAGAITVATLEGHTGSVYGCAFSPDGTRIVSASYDKTLRVWDVAGATTIATLEGHTGPVNGCAYSPDGTRIVSASDDHTLRIWDVATTTTIAALEGHTGSVLGCAFSPDGTRIVSASDDHTLRIWGVATTTTIAALEGHTGSVLGCAFSPDGTRIVSASDDHTLQVWDVAGTSCLTLCVLALGGPTISPDWRNDMIVLGVDRYLVKFRYLG